MLNNLNKTFNFIFLFILLLLKIDIIIKKKNIKKNIIKVFDFYFNKMIFILLIKILKFYIKLFIKSFKI